MAAIEQWIGIVLGIIGIAEVVIGVFIWYVRQELRIIRLEYVSHNTCDKHRDEMAKTVKAVDKAVVALEKSSVELQTILRTLPRRRSTDASLFESE